MQWILGIALAAAVFVILKQWGALSPERKKAATWKVVLVIAGALLLFMVLTGRVHVLTAAVAALIPLLRKLPVLLKFAPVLSRLFGAGQARAERQPPSGRQASDSMSVKEACDILGVADDCPDEDIIMAHRRLIQKLHPDRGGNDYLAARINEAKQVLLARRRG
ncbi:MAG TPA: DnaJ domain-containing protein [Marinobacter sp.]|uniref:DnaJ domain-containing protein n=1 Tax=Marinobacter sp. TaxID=50741 RepID=UPI002608ACC8|nr:DnaJ domain-containing protein [Marinobacter sp.]HET8800870.1 DnaJ domain-containing protein [Marinobacter sp.]